MSATRIFMFTCRTEILDSRSLQASGYPARERRWLNAWLDMRGHADHRLEFMHSLLLIEPFEALIPCIMRQHDTENCKSDELFCFMKNIAKYFS